MKELSKFNEWTFFAECKPSKTINELLIEGEECIAAYKTIRDVAAITNKRIIIADKQGLTGKKIEVYTIPFKSINMYSTENGGKIDFNSELQLWTRAGHIKINLKKKIDIRKLDRVIANCIL